jgi:hypothetical protein
MRKLILSLIAAAIAGTNGMAQSGFTRAGWEPEIVAYYHGDDMADYVTDFIELNPAVFEDLDNASTPWSFSPWTNAKENRDKIGAAGQRVGKETAWAVTWMLVIPYLASFLYVFAIQAKFVNRVVDTLHFSVLLPFRHLKETILMVVAMGAVIYFNVTTNVAVNVATLVFGAGFLAYIFSVYYINVFDHYIPREPEEEELKTETGDRE